MVIDLSGLSEAMSARGYDLAACRSVYSLAVFGSRAANCHRPDSDWDVVTLGTPQLSDRGPGLDFLREDPPKDSYWYARDLAFHLTGYAVWLSGGPNWDPALLQWDLAIARKTKRVREIALSLGRLKLHHEYEWRWMKKCMEEAGRISLLRQQLPICPTSLLPRPTLDDFRELGVDASFLRRLEGLP